MLVVDLLHEFELGVWKALFTHLIRVLYAAPNGPALVQELNRRYRLVAPFGSSRTIRRFSNNASEMKKLAARDFEDLLQCAIPVFEDLLPEPHNRQVLKLLYRTAEWHAIAKLRLHTERTIDELNELSRELGNLLRAFRDSSANFNTLELPREAEARARRQRSQNSNSQASSARRKKTLNFDTYKFHAIVDYTSTIPIFGPTDGYSTQVGEMCHQQVKRHYGLTNKRDAAGQIAQRYRRNAMLRDPTYDDVDAIIPEQHHQISSSRDSSFELRPWLAANVQDPARKRFFVRLKEHLLRRLLRRPFDGDTDEKFTEKELDSINIVGNELYEVKTMRINYTTYDVRRDSDLVNSGRENSFVMVNSPDAEDPHPFWYARVMGIFHAQVSLTRTRSNGQPWEERTPMEFLWVRWLGVEPAYRFDRRVAATFL
ncbi:hypothetical protein PM082_012443 [Marasmius tenuissimus]|nr:hypothetical protein PM082_012443 [Marasmius tenuissimus]